MPLILIAYLCDFGNTWQACFHGLFAQFLKTYEYRFFIPQIWKLGTVIPLYKGKKLRTDKTKYRPITITCFLSRIYENVLLIFMKPVLSTVISKYQHGIFEKRSTFTNLI